MLRTYKLRLYPKPEQERILFQTLNVTRNWYNMCLEERKLAWEFEKRNVSSYDQGKTSVFYRRAVVQAQSVSSQTLKCVCADLDKSFKSFFRRVKAGEKPGFPRFKSYKHWHSFGYISYNNGWRLDGRRLRLFGVGRVRVRWNGYLVGQPKSLRIVHKANHWYACVACDMPDLEPLPKTGQIVGLDVGISAMLTTSDGQKVDNPKYYREGQVKLRRVQRALSRKQRGSKNRRKAVLRVQKVQEYTANQRKDFLHKLTRSLVDNYDLIAIEDLQVQNMTHNRHLSKSILDSGWYMFRQFLTYKAESAGREVVAVNPAYTSKTCSNCGAEFVGLTLADRWVTCDCGLSLDRDHNAAINILARIGRGTSVSLNVIQ